MQNFFGQIQISNLHARTDFLVDTHQGLHMCYTDHYN
jgi:hypothetical protein